METENPPRPAPAGRQTRLPALSPIPCPGALGIPPEAAVERLRRALGQAARDMAGALGRAEGPSARPGRREG